MFDLARLKCVFAGNDYFVVKTVRGGGENIYVPIDRAEKIIRPIMSQKEAEELIEYIKTIDIEFNKHYKYRYKMKKSLIALCLVMLIAMVASSCTHHTCPAYRGSIAEVVE